jgi:RHS repeat-associated protein
MSFAELSDDEYTVDLLLPQGGWATFTFAAGSAVSEINYRHNAWLEKIGSSGNFTSLVLHHPDGSGATYGLRDDTFDPSGYRVYYRTDVFDPANNKTTFTYDTNFTGYFGLTNVTAADGTSFTLQLDNQYYPDLPATVTNITSSYGASISFRYSVPNYYDVGLNLTNIIDAAGISSTIGYSSGFGFAVNELVTPYGTTTFGVANDTGLFDRSVRITNALGQQEFYGLIGRYEGADWPAFSAGQIPTNTLVGTLDSSERTNRNTFYWNAQQFAAYANIDLNYFNWTNFNSARIRHWLSSPDSGDFDYTLSVQQQPSPSNWTNIQGQLTWFDYVGKPANYERGLQIMPAVISRVMPDGSTAYQYFTRLTNGWPTKMVEKWANGNVASYRTNTYSYAANNVDMTLHIGPNAEQVSSNVFNAYHQVTTNYDALNQATTHIYDGTTHQRLSTARSTGLTTTNIYDGNHRLQKVIDLQISCTNSYTWFASGNVEGHTSERGLSVTNYWDGLNRLTGTKHPDGTTTSNLYIVGSTKILELTATKDRLGYWTYFGYDALRRKTAETNANGAITRWGYCDCGATAHVTNAWSTAVEFVMQYDYDYQGNNTFIRYPDATITNWFDSLQRRYLTYDAWGSRGFYYDNLNRLTNTSNAYGTEQNTTYDIENHPIYVTDANGVTITNTYDLLGRLGTRTQPDGGMEKFGYSARGLIAYTNQLDKITYYGYDEGRRKTWETNANNEIIRYTNNAAGDLLSLTDGKSQTTKWNYDEYGRVTKKLDQASVEILRYKYDADSRLSNRWSVAKGTTIYGYDLVGNLTNINYPASTDVRFTYDALNRASNMVDAVGTTAYGYAAGGQLWTEDGPWSSDTVTNTYNTRLRTALSLAQPTGRWTNGFGYDAAKRLTNVTSQAGSFTYTLGGASYASPLPKKILLPNTSYITNTYDSVARLTGTYLKNSSDTTLNSHEYSCNPGNQRTQQVFNVGSTYNYTYDAIGQLTIADSGTASEDRGYTYDTAWNLNYRTNNGSLQSFIVDGLNELTNAVGATCRYDANGNLTNYAGATFTYDDENRLAMVEDVNHAYRWAYLYDGMGRLRIRQQYQWQNVGPPWAPTYIWIATLEWRYLYDGRRVIQERTASGTIPTYSYTRGTDLSGSLEGAGGIGGLLAHSQDYASSNGNWYTHNYYHADGNGNITYLVDSSQALAASYRYDPYGNTISSSGSLASANVYRFSSKEIHANSGLYYYGYRWYAPNLQRWLNRDPIQEQGGLNLYCFLLNNPSIYIDPYGLKHAGGYTPPIEICGVWYTNLDVHQQTPFLSGGKFAHGNDPTRVIVIEGPVRKEKEYHWDFPKPRPPLSPPTLPPLPPFCSTCVHNGPPPKV